MGVAASNDPGQTRRDRIHPDTVHPQGKVHESRIASCSACDRFVECLIPSPWPPIPAREAAGWKNWADFAENVAANVGEEDYNANGVKTACKGVTGMTIGARASSFRTRDRA